MNELPIRKQIRLSAYDYSKNGYYYITVCTQNRDCIFGNIVDNKMVLNNIGKIVENVWYSLPQHHPVELDIFQIMPNHIHFILIIDQTGASRCAPTLGFIIGMFKTECTKQINQFRKTPGGIVFQRNFYEHVIRNEEELYKIQEYIEFNPNMWEQDEDNLSVRARRDSPAPAIHRA